MVKLFRRDNKLRIAVMSDLHCEFHRDNGRSFINSLHTENVDVIVLAGDINIARGGLLADTLNNFCSRFKNQDIVYILGNHEFYGSNRESVIGAIRETESANPNLIWLDNGVATIRGRRFLGTPLWFASDPLNIKYQNNISDFQEIEKFTSWVYKENQKAVNFLKSEIHPGDIVVTHHLPTKKSVPGEYANSPLNRFFVCNVEEIINSSEPALWIHGHTHSSHDYHINKTRIICNPFGYPGTGETLGFKGRKTVNI